MVSPVDGKLPPHNIEAEEAILGSIIIDPGALEDVMGIIKPGDFYREKNMWVYEAAIACQGKLNQITLAQELAQNGRLEAIGGGGFLSLLVERLPTSLHAEHYASIVSRLSYCRKVISSAGQLAAIGYEADRDEEGIHSRITEIFHGLEPRISTDIYGPEDQALMTLKMLADGQPIEMVRFGYPNLDEKMGGMAGGDLIVLAARPKVGKSQVSLEVGLATAQREECVLYASAEMSIYQLLQRRVAMGTHIPVIRQRKGGLTPGEWGRVQEVVVQISETPLFIMTGHITPENVMQWAKRLKNSHNLKLLVFDYVQIVARRLGGDYGYDIRNKVAYLTAFLKEIAVTLNIPVICVSQISRQSETREGHRPTLSDLKECVSGGTEVILEGDRGRTIRDVFKKKGLQTLKVKTCDLATGEVRFVLPSTVVHTGTRPCVRLRFKSGKILTISKTSALCTANGWCFVDKLKVGDMVRDDITQHHRKTRKGTTFNSGKTRWPKGKTPWNEGLTAETDNRIANTAVILSAKLSGIHIPKPEGFDKIMRLVNPPVGTKMKNRGYVMIYLPDWHRSHAVTRQWQGYVYAHHYEIEKELGRPLTKIERVHHWDGDKEHNERGNLRYCRNASEHTKIHIEEQRFVERLVKEGKAVFNEQFFKFELR